MEDKDTQQEIAITEVKKDISHLQKDVVDIKIQVFNHLPTLIKELNDSFQEYKISNSRWIIGILVSTLFILVGTIINLLR